MPTTPSPARRRSRRSGARLALLAAGAMLLTAGCDTRDAYESTFALGFPDPITDQGKKIYDLWLGSIAAAGAVGLFVLLLIGYACVAFRKRGEELPRQVRYNLPIEVLYTVVPMVIVSVLFYYTAVSQNYVNKETKDPDVTIAVVGFQWNWQFNHLDGDDDPTNNVVVTGEPLRPARLVLPTNRTIRFEETSNDVIHSFWVPAFLFKRDVIPGNPNSFELTIRKEGTYVGRCTELCGEKHDRMNFEVQVVSPEAYDAYISEEKAKIAEQTGGLGNPAPGPAVQSVPGTNNEGEGTTE